MRYKSNNVPKCTSVTIFKDFTLVRNMALIYTKQRDTIVILDIKKENP